MGFFDSDTYRGAANLDESGVTAPTYDISALKQGKDYLNKTNYNPSGYNPYQFSTPSFGSIGNYGKTSPEELKKMYEASLSTATRPLLSQSAERMRSLSQGFEGGRMQGSAARELAMKNAMKTGSDIADIGSSIGSTMAERQLTQDETARQKEWEDKNTIRNTVFQAEQAKQTAQAAENFKAAGFSDTQAQTLAVMNMEKAKTMFDLGLKIPQLQSGLWQAEAGQSNKLYDYAWGGASYS